MLPSRRLASPDAGIDQRGPRRCRRTGIEPSRGGRLDAVVAPPERDAAVVARGDQREAVEIAAHHLGADGHEMLEGRRRRVPVVVVGTDADERDGGIERGEQRR
jgi:hypothetical protein